MEYQIIRVITEKKFKKKLLDFIAKQEVIKSWYRIDQKENNLHFSVLSPLHNFQKILDGIEKINKNTPLVPEETTKYTKEFKEEKASELQFEYVLEKHDIDFLKEFKVFQGLKRIKISKCGVKNEC